MSTASLATRARRRPRIGGLLSAESSGPTLVLVGGALLIALGAGLIATHVTVFALDESLVQQSALHYSSGLPHSLFHDLDARATDRLYSLVLSIAYRLTGGPAAIRLDHVLSVVMFVSAAFPIYVFARIVLPSRWSATLVALLSIAAPWLTLTSALFTENLSYPLFWWSVLAMCAAIWRPAPRRDLLAVLSVALLVGTRVQFCAIFVGYLICAVAVTLWRTGSAGSRARTLALDLRVLVRGFPVTALALLGVFVWLVHARFTGGVHEHLVRLLGGYSDVILRSSFPPNMTQGLLIEVIALALGVGLLPALVSIPWYVRVLARPAIERRWLHLAACGVLLSVFLLLTVYLQGGYLGEGTEERYFFYVIPAVWIGAFAALAEGGVRPGELALCGVAFAALFGAIPFLAPLSEETAFLAPVEASVRHVLAERPFGPTLWGLSGPDLLAVGALALAALAAILTSRPGPRVSWVLGLGALVQLLIVGYAFAAVNGDVSGIPGRTSGSSAPLGWVDDHAAGARVTWLDNLSARQPPAIEVASAGIATNQVHVTLFWNSAIRNSAAVPAAESAGALESPASALPAAGSFQASISTGALRGAAAGGIAEAVGQTESPFFQLAGSTLARSPDGFLTLTRVAHPARVDWLSEGLQTDSRVLAGEPVRVWAFPAGSERRLLTAHLTLAPLPPGSPGTAPTGATSVSVALGSSRREVQIPAGGAAQVLTLSDCPATGPAGVQGSITVASGGAADAVLLNGVSVQEGPAGASACRGGVG